MSLLQKMFGKRQKRTHPYCAALIAAAGSSTRYGGENKLLQTLDGIPVLVRTLLTIDRVEGIDEIVIAAREDELLPYAELCKTFGLRKPVKVIVGGATRTESVLRAALEASPETEFFAVQDGARPLVTVELIAEVLDAAKIYLAAAPAVQVRDTIKVAHDGIVERTPDRSALFAVQTPQVFAADLLKAALQSAIADYYGRLLRCGAAGQGSPLDRGQRGKHQDHHAGRPCDRRSNFTAQRGMNLSPLPFLEERTHTMTNLRIGHGYDVHRLTEGRALILGGVTIPYEKGLLGHSDADVLTHAVMDALLGAAALGDIGKLFPDSAVEFADISSLELLRRVKLHLAAAGYDVVNIDATILAQAPKLAPYREQMRSNIARELQIDVLRVSVKATTEEHLGFTGSGEGMAAHAIALLERADN